MSEIPADILRAAEEALDNLLCNCVESCGGAAGLRKASIEDIAKAILAERERCATVADDFSRSSLYADWPDDARSAGYYACGDIAAAIRKPKEPTQSAPINDDDLPF